MTDQYAVIGNPVKHSQSPFIHAQFSKQTQQKLIYTAELVELGKVAEFVNNFKSKNGKGLNVTVPFKQDAFELCDTLSERAHRAGAVNTLTLSDKIVGDTTDGVGLVNDLTHNHKVILKNTRILILGAGGAVRGVIESILKHQPAQLVIANRTVEKAAALKPVFDDLGVIDSCGFDDLNNEKFDLIINGTSASLNSELPAIPDNILNNNATIYDMMYSAHPTLFMDWGSQHKAGLCLDGLGMLVEQAAESFLIWRGVKPETQAVIKKLRDVISQ